MDNDSTRNGGPLSFADTLSPLERATLGLQASLSLFEVGKLTFPDNAKLQQSLVQTLISNAKAGNLPVYGNPDGWESRTCEETRDFRLGTVKRVFKNPFPATNLHQGTTGPISFGCNLDSPSPLPTKKEWAGNCCLVSHANYFAFLKTPLALGIPSPDHWLPPPAESIPPVETSLPELPERVIALVEAENAALVALRKALKREPDFDEFWDYLTRKDETGTIADFTDSRLDWIGHSGKSCSTAKSTIRNRLTAAKKRNPFTPS